VVAKTSPGGSWDSPGRQGPIAPGVQQEDMADNASHSAHAIHPQPQSTKNKHCLVLVRPLG
jgi:hypothetical protein